MSFDLPAELESRVAQYAERAHVTPEAAAVELIEDSLRRVETPNASEASFPSRDPEGSIGLFADLSNFVETIEQVIAGRESRYTKPR